MQKTPISINLNNSLFSPEVNESQLIQKNALSQVRILIKDFISDSSDDKNKGYSDFYTRRKRGW